MSPALGAPYESSVTTGDVYDTAAQALQETETLGLYPTSNEAIRGQRGNDLFLDDANAPDGADADA